MSDDPRRGKKISGWQRGMTMLTQRMTMFQTRMTLFRDRAAVLRERVRAARLHTLTGLGIGVALILLVLGLDLTRSLERLELMAVDFRFRLRGTGPESPAIVQVDMDDNTREALGRRDPNRTEQAAVLRVLGRLGARLAVYDIEFNAFDEKDPSHLALQSAFHDSERLYGTRVVIAHRFDVENRLPPDVQQVYPRIREALLKDMRLDPDRAEDRKKIEQELGVRSEIVRDYFEKIRTRVFQDEVWSMYESAAASGTALMPEVVRDRFLPNYNDNFDARLMSLAAASLKRAESIATIRSRVPPADYRFEGNRVLEPQDASSPALPLLREVQGFGHVNAIEDSDGTKRRSPIALYYQGRTYFHIGLVAAMDWLAGDPARVRIEIGPQGPVRLRYVSEGTEKVVDIPVDERCAMLVNWTGNSRQPRGFQHIPFAGLYQLGETWDKLEKATADMAGKYNFRPYKQVQGQILKVQKQLEERWTEWTPDLPAPQARSVREEIFKLQKDLAGAKGSLPDIEKLLVRQLENYIGDGMKKAEDPSLPEAERNAAREEVRKVTLTRQAIVELREAANRLAADVEPKIRGKAIVIGTSATASGDLHTTPRAPTQPGVDIIANTANTVMMWAYLYRFPRWADLAILIGSGVVVTMVVTLAPPLTCVLFFVVCLAAWLGASQWLFAARNVVTEAVAPGLTIAFCYTGITTFRYFTEKREKGKVRKLLEGRTSKEYVAEIMRNPDDVKPGGSKVEASVMFSDIRKFTTISETMAPEELITYINQYHDPMTRIIMARGGFLDKYIGDGIMAVFGAPVKSKDHSAQACLAALENVAASKVLSDRLKAEGLPGIYIRVGISTGPMIAGEIGSSVRHEYSVMGDRVNLASRLEGANKAFNTQIMIAERTRVMAGDEILGRELGLIQVVGKEEPERVYELLGKKGDAWPFAEGFIEKYKEGIKHYQIGEFDRALPAFEASLALRPGDGPCQVYIDSCRELMRNPPNLEAWRGVIELHEK